MAKDGHILMELGPYPFSEHYGWVQDKYGVSWQLILAKPDGDMRPNIIPSLMFAGSNCGKAEDAINFYTSVFKDTQRGITARYGKNQAPDAENNIMFADFMIENTWFAIMESARVPVLFNEAISFVVRSEDQEEIDYYWQKLSADPKSEQCGWLKDKFGLSWQIVPKLMDTIMRDQDKKAQERVTKEFLKMKKFDLAKLLAAYKNK